MAAEHVERIGARIRQRREELKLSRGEVTRKMPGKTSENQLYRWEKGLHRAEPENLEALAVALDVEPSYFYVDQPDKTETPDPLAGLTIPKVRPSNAELEEQLDRVEEAQEDIIHRLDYLIANVPGLVQPYAPRAATGQRRKPRR